LHEEAPGRGSISPERYDATTTTIGIFVDDVDTLINHALSAGATLISTAMDYDYGYRQGMIKDPFGHKWLIQSKL